MNNVNEKKLLEDYFSGQLSNRKSLLLLKALENNPDLKKEFELYKLIQKGVIRLSEKQLQEKIQSIEDELESNDFFSNQLEIDAYFANELSPFQVEFFKERLRTDAAFAKEFQEYKEIKESFKQQNQKSTRKKILAIENELEKKGFFDDKNDIVDISTTAEEKSLLPETSDQSIRKSKIIKLFHWKSVATIAACLLFIISFYNHFIAPPINQLQASTQLDVKSEGYEKEVELYKGTTVGFTDEDDHSLYKQGILLMDENPVQAINKFEKINEQNNSIRFYLAVCYLLTDRKEDSLPILKNMDKNEIYPSPITKADVQWYLANAYLKNNTNKREAYRLLSILSKGTSKHYKEKAEEIITNAE